ncbi:helix-turn-helix domain-containing protein [Acetobacterium wieringae]|uniref:Helix-turn-helix domain-containing protein n=1 Tax=Acetobacterium wieringae TaxID=52694 RepID=A0ABY6HG96_9FIRM|nr:helix-turn-helix transcriptional regulator [Acetobacterium wieringae]UYO63422.1 helix-turn-helix domain-containing protein [Acetobacterium wieringae]VUZ23939.1 Uncharacterised protein [Acetobacterium wieringae]
MAEFKERLKELVREKGETQTKIVDDINKKFRAGLSKQAFSYYVNGREPNHDTLKIFAEYFGVTVDYLIGYSDVKKRENADVNSKLGLSDGAIDTLEGYNKYLPNILIPTVNLLLELEVPAGNLSLLEPYRKYTTLTDDEIEDRLEKLRNGKVSPTISSHSFDGRSRPYILSKIDGFLNTSLINDDSNTELYLAVKGEKRHSLFIEAQKAIDSTIINDLKDDLETLRIYLKPEKGDIVLEIRELIKDLELLNKETV